MQAGRQTGSRVATGPGTPRRSLSLSLPRLPSSRPQFRRATPPEETLSAGIIAASGRRAARRPIGPLDQAHWVPPRATAVLAIAPGARRPAHLRGVWYSSVADRSEPPPPPPAAADLELRVLTGGSSLRADTKEREPLSLPAASPPAAAAAAAAAAFARPSRGPAAPPPAAELLRGMIASVYASRGAGVAVRLRKGAVGLSESSPRGVRAARAGVGGGGGVSAPSRAAAGAAASGSFRMRTRATRPVAGAARATSGDGRRRSASTWPSVSPAVCSPPSPPTHPAPTPPPHPPPPRIAVTDMAEWRAYEGRAELRSAHGERRLHGWSVQAGGDLPGMNASGLNLLAIHLENDVSDADQAVCGVPRRVRGDVGDEKRAIRCPFHTECNAGDGRHASEARQIS